MFNILSAQVRGAGVMNSGIVRSIFLRVARVPVLSLVLISGPAAALAQEPVTSFDQLRLVLDQGDKITLVDPSGKSITGKINRLAPDGIDLKVGSGLQTFQEKDVRQITRQKPDSPLNGFLIGAGIGFGATLPVNLGIADSSEKGVAVAASALWGLIGGGIGALVDAFVHQEQLVFFRPRSNFSWSISPVLNAPRHILASGINSSKGLRVSFSF